MAVFGGLSQPLPPPLLSSFLSEVSHGLGPVSRQALCVRNRGQAPSWEFPSNGMDF